MFESIAILIAGIFGALAVLAFYLLPGIIASARQHNNSVPIWVLTILAGWSTIGWVIALVWALTDNTRNKYPIAY